MPPLILHNVPDDELYVGDDGVQRPYAMIFPQHDGGLHRAGSSGSTSRRPGPTSGGSGLAETGAFGKSQRRSRSKTGTPAGGNRREDPTLAAADRIFTNWKNNGGAGGRQADVDGVDTGGGELLLQNAADGDDTSPTAAAQALSGRTHQQQVPTEVILRGFLSPAQQYASVAHFENLAGRICEDYPRDPPPEMRRYRSELREAAFASFAPSPSAFGGQVGRAGRQMTTPTGLTPEERVKVSKIAGGEHWVKITFESAEAADAAIYASPQRILGCLVYAELYQGFPPTRDEAVIGDEEDDEGYEAPGGVRGTPLRRRVGARAFGLSFSPPESHSSSQTIGTATLSTATGTTTATMSSVTGGSRTNAAGAGDLATPTKAGAVFGIPTTPGTTPGAFNSFGTPATAAVTPGTVRQRARPAGARRLSLRPAEQALLPQPSLTARVLNHVPFLKWFSGSMIGNEVPRSETTGEFDWNRASLYWKVVAWLDATFGLFGGEVVGVAGDD